MSSSPADLVLGSEPDDLIFRAGDLLPLGSAMGVLPNCSGSDFVGRVSVYGLVHLAAVRPDDHGEEIDSARLTLCPVEQIALLDGRPVAVRSSKEDDDEQEGDQGERRRGKRTNTKTKYFYDTDTSRPREKDSAEDVQDE